MKKLILSLLLTVSVFTPELSEAKYCKYYRSCAEVIADYPDGKFGKEMVIMMAFPARTFVVQDNRLKICSTKWHDPKNQNQVRINNSIVQLTQ